MDEEEQKRKNLEEFKEKLDKMQTLLKSFSDESLRTLEALIQNEKLRREVERTFRP